ncbi:hypothetical protein F442_21602 [Phytophthora nicotianae P10297]|uniref:Uncharacterized protein n=2 Tax=Phytophthora nicotianae P10297 TaxID=1317064 RepID=W2Y4Z8_PHYNI|nr:hypothetical protein F442_21602 [Phytophthora nicotianae P10297]
MDEDREVFQDFSSDDSDFDDDVDWSFTDRESASVLQLMGGADSTKKPQRAGTAAISPSTVIKNTSATSSVPTGGDCITSGAVKGPSSDQKLLDELFPKTKTQLMSTAEIPIGEEQVRNKECEFEWALMALEEHESRSVSPVKGAADFASLFEEMYGGDTAIELSTPSKLEDDPLEKADSKQPVNDGIPSSPKAAESDEDTLPAEIFNMLQLVYTKATSEHRFESVLKYTCSRLNLPDLACGIDVSSLESCVPVICSLEQHLISQELVTSFASSREERLEFILSVLDNKIGSLPQTFKIKWVKTIEMLPLLIKMQEQRNCSEPASKRVVDLVNELQIDETAPKTKNKGSPLQGWAAFHPDKMPARLHEPTKLLKATSLSKQTATTSSKKPRVHLRQYLPSKLRVRCKVYNPEDSELTFRPKINKKHRKKDQEQEEKFADRMERDISLRRSQKLQLEQKREQHEREEAGSVAPVNFIAKGSQRILLRNGMWTESLEERLHRLAKHRTNTEAHDPRSKKRRQRHDQRKREASAVASRACESLYQRGLEQRKREQDRLLEDNFDLEFQRNRPKMSSRSLRVMKARIRQELEQLCQDCQRAESSDDDNSAFVTFIQFSCALLYFGFVTDLNTPWEENTSDSEITFLWHSWTVLTRNDSETPDSKLSMKVLERVLFSVILGGRAGDHSVLQGSDVQVLLRLYRANYYTRKQTQLKEEPSQPNITKVNTKTSKQASFQRHRVRYNLHGKPIRNNETAESDLLSEREQLLQEKIDQLREAKAQQELEGCTFHPQINPGPVRHGSPLKSTTSSAMVSTFERLYSDAFQRQSNVLEKYLEAKLHREEMEKRESSVRPSYVNGLTIEERLENLHVALAGNALPVDFHKKIESMRTATEMKVLDEQIKEQRLLPARFKKAKDGRTIVLPFQFATEIRAAKSTKLMKRRTKAAHRPLDMMKGLRPLEDGDEREVQTPVRPSRMIEDDSNNEADLCLDVHLSPSETRQLYLNVHEDPHEVVEHFAQRFSLTNTQRHFLVQLVEARLEQLATY